MDGSAIFVKTPKGVDEMEHRTYRLHPRTRQVLIMVDGKRTRTALGGMVNVPDVDAVLQQLLTDGFIAPVASLSAPVSPPPVGGEHHLPFEIPVDPAERLKVARTFLINTTETFIGMFGSGLVEKAQEAKSLDDLRALVDDWYDAVVSGSGAGKKRGPELKAQLMALL